MKKKDKKDERLPGYPHYPAQDDIMNKDSEGRVDADVENMSRQVEKQELKKKASSESAPQSFPDASEAIESDVTKEDLDALGPKDLNNDGGDDEILKEIAIGPDFSGDDLDVPGSEDDDEMEAKGSEDEENNYYSRGQE